MKVKETISSFKTHQKKFTYQDYLNLPDDGKRYELINGEFVMVAAPYTIHQTVKGNLYYVLRVLNEREKMGFIFDAPTDVVFSETIVVQPDILFISKKNSHYITEKSINGVPELIIEILSPTTAYYDLIEKKEIYEKFGVSEYWIVDPKKQWIEIYNNLGKKYELIQRGETEGIIQSKLLKGLKINLQKIFSSD